MNKPCKRIICLAFAGLLLLLSSCQTRPVDRGGSGSETTVAQIPEATDIRSQEEILEEIFAQTDGPVVVRLVPSTPILYKETAYPQLINQPHVLDVLFVSIVHWLDISDEGSLCMIGQYAPDLDPAVISEGRWYETEDECCVNRAEYERLLADPESGFTGLGSKVTYTEPDFHLPLLGGRLIQYENMDPRELEAMIKLGRLTYVVPAQKTFTVVGIVGEEGEYSDPAFGVHHMYTLTDTVGEMLVNYRYDYFNEYDSRLDLAIYAQTQAAEKMPGTAVYRPDSEQADTPQIRCADDKYYTEEEWESIFWDLPCNAGYTVEVTLDSGKSYAAYMAAYRSNRYYAMTAKGLEELRLGNIERAYETYDETMKKIENGQKLSERSAKILLEDTLARTVQDPTIQRLLDLGEALDAWRVCMKGCVSIHPLRVEE